MMRACVFILLAIAAGCFSASVPQKETDAALKPMKKLMVRGRPSHGFVPTPEELNKPGNEAVTTPIWFTSKLDHFDSTNSQTFQQRYWYNPTWYQATERYQPVFLMLGGEGPGSSSWVTNEGLYFVTMAEKYKAAVFEFEHRYYGQSRPTPNQSTANLKWLSSRQALEDTADFIRAMNTKYQWNNPKWIVFGGSYSGAMAAWMRQNYPDLVAGAVATSGPVLAKLDFLEYIDVVQTSLRTHDVNCANAVRDGMTQLQTLMSTGSGRQQVSQLFNLCPAFGANPPSTLDVENFYDNVMGNFMYTVQYSEDNVAYFANQLTIPAVCNMMTASNGHSLVQKLADVNTFVGRFLGGGCTGTSYNDFIDGMKQTSFDAPYADYRSWVWQTCTEFGYFQSTDKADNIFGSNVPVKFYVDQCTQIFGDQFNQATIQAAIDSTDQFYGGVDKYRGTNVVLPNGSVDPWHALGILSNKGTSTIAAYITGTAHCADMYPARAADPPGLTQARITIDQTIAAALAPCPAGYSALVQGNNNCYKMMSTAMSWMDAEKACMTDGGHLASVHNAFENNALATFAGAANPNANTWIGLTNNNNPQNQFWWTDMTSTAYMNWASGQPAQANALHCVQQAGKSASSPGMWMTADCSMPQQFICNINI